MSFKHTDVEPPSLLYIQRDDQLTMLAMTGTANQTFTLVARLWLADEGRITTIESALVAPTAFALVSVQVPLAEGYLLSAAIRCGLSTQQGDAYVELLVTRGVQGFPSNVLAKPASVLIAEYVTVDVPAGWPGGRISRIGDGPGTTLQLLVTQPGAGADWNTVVLNNALWELLYFNATFVTGAAVANRLPQLTIGNGATVSYTAPPANTVPASTTANVSGSQMTTAFLADLTDVMLVIPPRNLLITPGQISFVTKNIQAADQWSNIRLTVRQWVGV